jgi:catechol 2,3-dioxygenase-like lactoylglutathione lyase family enzyme
MSKSENRPTAWPAALAGLGAIRFSRSSCRFREVVAFYRDVVGLRLYESFEESYGSNGAIFVLPDSSVTLEIVESAEPVAIDPHEQLCLYFGEDTAMAAVRDRLVAAGAPRAVAHPYWQATGAVAFRDPEGRVLILAPFVYGKNEPAAGSAEGRHAFHGPS